MKTTYYRIIYLLFFLSINTLVYAQNNTISGFITDKETGEALIGANVFIQETGNGMSTDKNGYYVLQNISSGNYSLIVSYIGYNTFKKDIVVLENESIKMDIFCYIETDDSIKCIIQDREVDHEGYVMENGFGTFKLVDRETFSYHNFNIAKSW